MTDNTELRELLVEGLLPDWVKQARTDSVPENREHAADIEVILREWNSEYIDTVLATLDGNGYVVAPSTIVTLTVDHPNDGLITSVHADEEAAIADLASLWAHLEMGETDNVVQALCDNGYVIYINEHSLREVSK